MLSIHDAQSHILQHARRNPAVYLSLRHAIGQVLAEDIASDIDSPPYAKSLVDGYAIISADMRRSGVVLDVIEQVTAVNVPKHELCSGQATCIMTGAPMPAGADAVVMVEQTVQVQRHGRASVRIDACDVEVGQHTLAQGAAIQRGEVVFHRDRPVRAIDVGLLSEVGRTRLRVYRRPRIAILATGDELVPPGWIPGPGQIRNSNSAMLAAMVRTAGGQAIDSGICRDDTASLRQAIERGLQCDVLLLSGGVSAGVMDLVPRTLQDLGVEQVFHKVRLRPGKPLWFGTCNRAGCTRLVFGLPGNPVGSLVCFELFVRPVIYKLSGRNTPAPHPTQARLERDYIQRGDRPTYHPALARRGEDGQIVVTALAWKGSADQRAISMANCLIFFPPGAQLFAAGSVVEILWLDRPDR